VLTVSFNAACSVASVSTVKVKGALLAVLPAGLVAVATAE
jgi:hypothetical protein